MQSFGSSLMQTTISINDIKFKAHQCSLLLAQHYSITTALLQHIYSITEASLKDHHYSISTYSIPTAALQHHQGKVRMQDLQCRSLQSRYCNL